MLQHRAFYTETGNSLGSIQWFRICLHKFLRGAIYGSVQSKCIQLWWDVIGVDTFLIMYCFLLQFCSLRNKTFMMRNKGLPWIYGCTKKQHNSQGKSLTPEPANMTHHHHYSPVYYRSPDPYRNDYTEQDLKIIERDLALLRDSIRRKSFRGNDRPQVGDHMNTYIPLLWCQGISVLRLREDYFDSTVMRTGNTSVIALYRALHLHWVPTHCCVSSTCKL